MPNNIVILQLLEILKNNKEVIEKSPSGLSFMDIHGGLYDNDFHMINIQKHEDIKPIIESINKILKGTSHYYEIDFTYNLINVYQFSCTMRA